MSDSIYHRYPPTEAEVREKPGYFSSLHERDADDRSKCGWCGEAWPCPGAQHQIKETATYAREWWYLPFDRKTGMPIRRSA